jgi:UDP-2,4-diacetamido-2,4,6-trideoxy-beta-L-altropyranose hydrolase
VDLSVAFRVDSSVSIGAGHLMRCLALAESLRARSADVGFYCRRLPGNLGGLIEEQGFAVRWLPRPAGQRTGCWFGGADRDDDARETAAAIEAAGAKLAWLVVDHYGIDLEWERRLRPLARRILAIDDLRNRRHDCDLLVDQNLYEEPRDCYADLTPPECRRLIGPTYAMLRPEFSAARKALRTRSAPPRRILVFFGGTDPSGETAKALESLTLWGRDDVHVDVVAGPGNPRAQELLNACARRPNAAFYRRVSDMAKLMNLADLAIGAGGVSAWERCCLGLPAIVVAVADNQERGSRLLGETGCASYLGRSHDVDARRLAERLDELCAAPETLASLGRNAAALVDGEGVGRVVDAMGLATHALCRRAL